MNFRNIQIRGPAKVPHHCDSRGAILRCAPGGVVIDDEERGVYTVATFLNMEERLKFIAEMIQETRAVELVKVLGPCSAGEFVSLARKLRL